MHDSAPPPIELFDDRRARHPRADLLALAFGVGAATTLYLMHTARRQARPAGPADGAPLMRAPLQVVAPVDLKRYAGVWHEQARLPGRHGAGGAGHVSTEYIQRPDGTLAVHDRCVRDDGQVRQASGAARLLPVAGLPGAGRLQVRFAPPWLGWLPLAWQDRWILKLDRDYQVALVGTPDRQALQVLSRVPHLADGALEAELDYARTLGFDVDGVLRTSPLPPAG